MNRDEALTKSQLASALDHPAIKQVISFFKERQLDAERELLGYALSPAKIRSKSAEDIKRDLAVMQREIELLGLFDKQEIINQMEGDLKDE